MGKQQTITSPIKRHDHAFVDKLNKLIFLNIPKNASTTIRLHLKLEHILLSSIKNKEQFKTFTVLRDPYSRVISSYQEVLKCRNDAIDPKFLKTAKYFKLYQQNEVEKSFNEFLNQLEIKFFDSHVVPQKMWLGWRNINIDDIHFVLNMNNGIQKEVYEMTKNLNMPIKIQSNKRPSNQIVKSKIQNIINTNQDIKNKVYKIYQQDFELIEYCENNIWN